MSLEWRKPTSVITADTGAAAVRLFVQPDHLTRIKYRRADEPVPGFGLDDPKSKGLRGRWTSIAAQDLPAVF